MPRELLDHVISFTSIFSWPNILSISNREPCESEKLAMSLWSALFKSDRWLERMVQEYNAEPVLVGSDLDSHSQGTYLILHVCAAKEGSSYMRMWKTFTDCLQEHTITNAEVRFNSGITLNVQELLLNRLDGSVQVPSAKTIFNFQEGNPKIQYSFYKGPRVRDLDIRYIDRDRRDWNWKIKLIAGSEHDAVVTIHYRMEVDALQGSDDSFWKGVIQAAERRKQ
ncbi:hypothetical protein N7540_011124 [Penicillium herquei]|nr:hypothetical protein N7540_011124 [Penicillium herquei]